MILLQIYTVIIAAALAWMNRIPCVKMTNYGASRKEEKEWHWVNPIMKGLFIGFMLFEHGHNVQVFVHVLLLTLIMWTVFDVVLAILLHGWKGWYYLGDTSKLDRLLKYGIRVKKAVYRMGFLYEHEKRILGMGKYAGIVKVLVSIAAIFATNFLL